MKKARFGFIGTGRIGSAMLGTLLVRGIATAGSLLASDALSARRRKMERDLGIRTTDSNREVVRSSQMVFVCVKPHEVPALLREIGPEVRGTHLLVSVAAGFRLSRIEKILGAARRVIRVMPNAPCRVGEVAAAFCPGRWATKRDIATVQTLLDRMGKGFRVPEKFMDVVTGLSGSGPAYLYLVIEGLAEGGMRFGLPRKLAMELAAQTVVGAGRMVLETGGAPRKLIDEVASPGGTTIRGLRVLNKAKVKEAFREAVDAATRRSRELAKGK